jgi:membrane protein DedA with SNARE-associated domain
MRRFGGWIAVLLALIRAHALPGLFLVLLLEEAGLPRLIPGDTLVIAAGARPGQTLSGALEVIVTATAAATLGSALLFALVRRGGRPLLERYGGMLRLDQDRLRLLDGWFQRHGMLPIIVGRLIPGLRTPTTIVAGLAGVPLRTFVPATSLAALLWASLYYASGLALLLGRRQAD